MTSGADVGTTEASVVQPLEPSTPLSQFQMIDYRGRPTPAGQALGIDLELAQEFYSDMVLGRRFDSEALALQRQGELSPGLMT